MGIELNLNEIDLGFDEEPKAKKEKANIGKALEGLDKIQGEPRKQRKTKKEKLEQSLAKLGSTFEPDLCKKYLDTLETPNGESDTVVVSKSKYESLVNTVTTYADMYNDIDGIFYRVDLLKELIAREVFNKFNIDNDVNAPDVIPFTFESVRDAVIGVSLPTVEDIRKVVKDE